jgi:hypothetical protein
LEERLDNLKTPLFQDRAERAFGKIKAFAKTLRSGGCCLHGRPMLFCKTCRKLNLPDAMRGDQYEELPGLDVAEYWYRKSGRTSFKVEIALNRINDELKALEKLLEKVAEKLEARILDHQAGSPGRVRTARYA